MFIKIEYKKSAFRHGFSIEDINWAYTHYRYDGPIEDMDNKFLRIGFNQSGNLLEIMYNEIDEHSVNIFHVMKCRSIYFHLLNL